jgi:hypothetical protein
MWPQNPNSMTHEERQREIRRLEAVRDRLLEAAPKHSFFQRLLLPIMLTMMLFVVWHTISTRPFHLAVGSALSLAGLLLVLC